jgi:hypothetical protein
MRLQTNDSTSMQRAAWSVWPTHAPGDAIPCFSRFCDFASPGNFGQQDFQKLPAARKKSPLYVPATISPPVKKTSCRNVNFSTKAKRLSKPASSSSLIPGFSAPTLAGFPGLRRFARWRSRRRARRNRSVSRRASTIASPDDFPVEIFSETFLMSWYQAAPAPCLKACMFAFWRSPPPPPPTHARACPTGTGPAQASGTGPAQVRHRSGTGPAQVRQVRRIRQISGRSGKYQAHPADQAGPAHIRQVRHMPGRSGTSGA